MGSLLIFEQNQPPSSNKQVVTVKLHKRKHDKEVDNNVEGLEGGGHIHICQYYVMKTGWAHCRIKVPLIHLKKKGGGVLKFYTMK